MTIRSFFLFLFILGCSCLGQGQGWERTFGDGLYQQAIRVLPTTNGNLLVRGVEALEAGGTSSSYNRLFNNSGDQIWVGYYEASNTNSADMKECSDGTFLIETNRLLEIGGNFYSKDGITKINPQGKTLWEYTVEENQAKDSYIFGMQLDEADQVTFFELQEDENLKAYKLDSGGNLQGVFTADIPSANYDIRRLDDQFVFRQAFEGQSANSVSWTIYRTDLEGNLNTSQTYNDFYVAGNPGQAEMLDNGDWVLVCNVAGSNIVQQIYLDAFAGTTTIDTIWGADEDFAGLLSFKRNGDELATLIYRPESSSIALVKTNVNGDVIWRRNYNHQPVGVFPNSVVFTQDGGFAIVGEWQDDPILNYLIKTDSSGRIYPNIISGKVYLDSIPNCQLEEEEKPLSNWIVSAESEANKFVVTSESDGSFTLPAENESYTVKIARPNEYWEACENDLPVTFTQTDTFARVNFPVQTVIDCPNLSISHTVPSIRPCFERPSYVNYCNFGTVAAEDAYVEITYDSLISPVSASIPFEDLGNGTYRFQVGDLSPLECGDFVVNLFLDCDATVGAAYCIEAHAYPDSLCLPPSTLWSGAFLEISGFCQNDSILFRIENTGDGNMEEHSRYIIVEDVILRGVDSVDLDSGDFEDVKFEGNGSTFTIIAEQVPEAPGLSNPIGIVEGCGVDDNEMFSIGFSNQFSLNDANPYLDVDCPVAVSSYDPNDKRGFPLGYGEDHFIEPGTPIEYIIRFQNTGTDTAFTVIIRDTLPDELDITSFQSGASSHSYTYSIEEGVVVFNFQNILLPDSTTNEVASNGFVEFKINPRSDLALGTVIRNRAAIFFDFNDPIITNESYHTIEASFLTFIVGLSREPFTQTLAIEIRPNPFRDRAIISIIKDSAESYWLELFNINGQLVRKIESSSSDIEVQRNGLVEGIYFYKIHSNEGGLNAGKLIVH